MIMQKILFIEDESALQKMFGDALFQEGYEVVSALDGEIGLRLAKEKQPDLILLDLIIPKYHGLEVLEKLKSDESTSEIPVVVLTNSEDMTDVQKALELGATTFLLKASYDLDDVLDKIKQTLNELE